VCGVGGVDDVRACYDPVEFLTFLTIAKLTQK